MKKGLWLFAWMWSLVVGFGSIWNAMLIEKTSLRFVIFLVAIFFLWLWGKILGEILKTKK